MNKLQIGKMPQLPFEVSEAINQLRINLSFCGSDVKTIMITSSTPNEGKSFADSCNAVMDSGIAFCCNGTCLLMMIILTPKPSVRQ